MTEIIGQAIGAVAMVCNILSYQMRRQSRVLLCQLLGGLLFSVSFLLLGAVMGGLMNLVATLRALLFLFSEKTHARHPAWLGGFLLLYFGLYTLTFTLLGVEPRPLLLAVELLPVIGMTALSVAFMLNCPRAVRRLGLIASPAWLLYNVYYRSVGAILCECFSLVSIVVGMLRCDRTGESESNS